jgi:hypothetical protein
VRAVGQPHGQAHQYVAEYAEEHRLAKLEPELGGRDSEGVRAERAITGLVQPDPVRRQRDPESAGKVPGVDDRPVAQDRGRTDVSDRPRHDDENRP